MLPPIRTAIGVVDNKRLEIIHRLGKVEFLVGVFSQKIDHHSHMPCVLGIILASDMTTDLCLAQDVLFLVGSQNKR